MKLAVEVKPRPSIPVVAGPHELSWSYILDAVFADAHRRGIGALSVVLPTEALRGDVSLRSELTSRDGRSGARGLALLAGRDARVGGAPEMLYLLDVGRTYLPPRRPAPPEPGAWRLEWSLDVMRLRARLQGLSIRTALLLDRADLADRASSRMRRLFASDRPTISRYRLSAWSRAGSAPRRA